MDEDKTPENYFCELCEKKLHRVFTDSRGYVYVFYLITTHAWHHDQLREVE